MGFNSFVELLKLQKNISDETHAMCAGLSMSCYKILKGDARI